MIDKIIDEFKNKKIAILGFGMEGKSTYKLLRKHLGNVHITILDSKDVSKDEILKDDKNISFEYGDNYLDNLINYDIVVKSPGIPNKLIKDNVKDRITSQLELLLNVYRDNMIGVTASKGKSTTSTLIYEVIKAQRDNVYLIGNIGIPVLEQIEDYNKNSILVTEMSYQQMAFINKSPHIGMIINLYEEHLDHAGTLEKYRESKLNMFKYQNKDDIALYSSDIDILENLVETNKYSSIKYAISNDEANKDNNSYIKNNYVYLNDKKLYNTLDERKLLGEHNLRNIMFALTVSEILKLDLNKTLNTINSFTGLEHRMELVGTYNDITYYNDSIATIPLATINAIKALKKVNTLICGGLDRGIDLSDLIKFLNEGDVENLILMPTTGRIIKEELEKLNTKKTIYFIETLDEAVSKAKEVTKKNTICLMSPAAASYEQFKNFEEKGKKYKELVRNN